MPRISDNIALELLLTLRQTLGVSHRSDFCVGDANLRGWNAIDGLPEQWPGGIWNHDVKCRIIRKSKEKDE